jgi:nitrous oxidase accessory protein NosD
VGKVSVVINPPQAIAANVTIVQNGLAVQDSGFIIQLDPTTTGAFIDNPEVIYSAGVWVVVAASIHDFWAR